MPPVSDHPAERFRAPASIGKGMPLKRLLGPPAVALIAESLAAVVRGFDRAAFIADASAGLGRLELKPRAQRIAVAMARHLAGDPAVAARQLIDSLGPELASTSGNGLKPFFYFPHAMLIRDQFTDWAAGMAAIHALTRRFTGEFSLRPYLIRAQDRTLARLAEWVGDPNPHVRRLVSEGTRPRLPWAERLPALVRDPSPALPLLDRLVDDPELYVRRSVANHVGDIAKDHPGIAFDLCRAWLARPTEQRRWVVRHALRLPARHRVAAALALRSLAGGR